MQGASIEHDGAAVEVSSSGTATCQSGRDRRVITVKPSETFVCEVHYQANGAARMIARAASDEVFCTSVVRTLVSELLTEGFTCQQGAR